MAYHTLPFRRGPRRTPGKDRSTLLRNLSPGGQTRKGLSLREIPFAIHGQVGARRGRAKIHQEHRCSGEQAPLPNGTPSFTSAFQGPLTCPSRESHPPKKRRPNGVGSEPSEGPSRRSELTGTSRSARRRALRKAKTDWMMPILAPPSALWKAASYHERRAVARYVSSCYTAQTEFSGRTVAEL